MTAVMSTERNQVAWWLLGVVLVGVVGYVLYAFIGTFVFGVFLYYATRPIYARIEQRIRPPSLAAGFSLVLLALPVMLLLAYTVAIALQELSRLAAMYELAELEAMFGPYLDVSSIPVTPAELATGDRLPALMGTLGAATAYLGLLGTGALHLFVMIAIAFYLLRDDYRLARWAGHRFGDDAGVLESYATAVDRRFHQVFFGNILNAVLTGTIGAIVYSGLDLVAPGTMPVGIPYPMLLGLLAGAASLIPIVGMKLVYVPASVYLFAVALLMGDVSGLWFPLAFFVLSFVVVDTIPDLVLRPYVSGRQLHVGMLMFAYILGPLLFGWYGIFLGPMLLVMIVEFVRKVLPVLAAGEPLDPVTSVPAPHIDPVADGVEDPETDPTTDASNR